MQGYSMAVHMLLRLQRYRVLCREAGVRSLKQLLEKTYRKVALKLVRGGLSGPTQQNPAQPGDTVAEHGGVGQGDEEAPQQAPPDAASSG